ncbi:hypothetical protein EIP91_003850 [Steccherinum ochraceum]|uniref:Uncharacterized protein n=1 Tax=Steccherinum ochraceum TaxID=92696 RepID=A0A4R0RCB4_9APHY|nr:hypothetical protein EIP91_003850 [Steccherinum ochraceum]
MVVPSDISNSRTGVVSTAPAQDESALDEFRHSSTVKSFLKLYSIMRFTAGIFAAAALVAVATTPVLAAPLHVPAPSVHHARDDFSSLTVRDVAETLNELEKRLPKKKASDEPRPARTPAEQAAYEYKLTRTARNKTAAKKKKSDAAAAAAMGTAPTPPPPSAAAAPPGSASASHPDTSNPAHSNPPNPGSQPGSASTNAAPGDDFTHFRNYATPDQPTIDPSQLFGPGPPGH